MTPFLISAYKSALILNAGCIAFSALDVHIYLINPPQVDTSVISISYRSVSAHKSPYLLGLISRGEVAGSKGLHVFEALPSRKAIQAAGPPHSWGGGESSWGRCPSQGLGCTPLSFSVLLFLSRAEPIRATVFQYPLGWPPVQELPLSLRAPPPGGWPLQPSIQWG